MDRRQVLSLAEQATAMGCVFPGDAHDACLTTSITNDSSLEMSRYSEIFDIGFVTANWLDALSAKLCSKSQR